VERTLSPFKSKRSVVLPGTDN